MRFLYILLKTLRQQSRDLLALSLVLLFAPCFMLLYSLFFPSGSTSYGVLVLNQDVPVVTADGTRLAAGEEIMASLRALTYRSGQPLLRVTVVAERGAAECMLRDRDAALLLIIPPELSRMVQARQEGRETSACAFTMVGDLTNPYYAVAAALAGVGLEGYEQAALQVERPLLVREEALGASAARSEFETYVPGLLIFAVLLLVFNSAMAITREVESGTLRRLRLSGLSAAAYLGGTSLGLMAVGLVAIVLAFLAALALGFRSQGPLWLAVLVAALTSFSVIGAGLVVAALARNMTQAFLIANFPLALFMFFSGVMYPLPRVTLCTIAGHSIGPYDLLPATHAVVALNKVLNLGAGGGELGYELGALLLLSALYFAGGAWLFRRRRLLCG